LIGDLLKTNIDSLSPITTSSELPLDASLFTVFLCILFGANAVAIKVSLVGVGVFTTAGIRFGAASIVILLWALYAGKPLKIKRTQLQQLIILALIFFVQLSFFYLGLSKTTASHGTLIANVLPFFVMILAHFFIPDDTITLKKIVGLILGFSGVVILFFDNLVLTTDALHGDLLVLLAVLVWSGNAIYIKKVINHFHPIQITLYTMMLAAPMFFVSGFFLDGDMVSYVDTPIVSSLLYQTLVTASFGMVAWYTMIRKYGATALHSFIFIMPISGVFLGVVLLNEPVTANLIISIIFVVTGLIVVNRQQHPLP